MTIEEARLRFREVVAILSDISTDLFLFSNEITDIPKMIESGFPPNVWAYRAQLALKYSLFERKLLVKRIKFQASIKK